MRNYMTVGELKQLIEKLPEDTIVVRSGSDHSYDPVPKRDIELVEAEYLPKKEYFWEYYNEENRSFKTATKIIKVLKV